MQWGYFAKVEERINLGEALVHYTA